MAKSKTSHSKIGERGHITIKTTQKQNQNQTGKTSNPELHVWHLELMIKTAGLQKTRIAPAIQLYCSLIHRLSPVLVPVHIHSSLDVCLGQNEARLCEQNITQMSSYQFLTEALQESLELAPTLHMFCLPSSHQNHPLSSVSSIQGIF